MVPKCGSRNQPHGSKSGQPRPRNPSSSDVHDLKRGRASVGHEPLGADNGCALRWTKPASHQKDLAQFSLGGLDWWLGEGFPICPPQEEVQNPANHPCKPLIRVKLIDPRMNRLLHPGSVQILALAPWLFDLAPMPEAFSFDPCAGMDVCDLVTPWAGRGERVKNWAAPRPVQWLASLTCGTPLAGCRQERQTRAESFE